MELLQNLTYEQLLHLLEDIRNTGEQQSFDNTMEFVKEIEVKIRTIVEGSNQ